MRNIEFSGYELNALLMLAEDHAKAMTEELNRAVDRLAASGDPDDMASVDHWTKHSLRADTILQKVRNAAS